jgi:hypothetical protein
MRRSLLWRSTCTGAVHLGQGAHASRRCHPSAAVRLSRRILGGVLLAVCMAAHSAFADPLTTTPVVVPFQGAVSVSDTNALAGATTSTHAAFPSLTVTQYNGPDILTGVQLQLNATRTPSGSVTGSGGTLPKSASGTGSSTGQISMPGAGQTFSTITVSKSCTTTTGTSHCSASVTGTAQHINQTFHLTTGLASYYGPGAFTVTRTAPSLTATASGTFNTVSFTYQEDWTGMLTTTYEYIKHANASFDGTSDVDELELNFGTVFQNSTAQQSVSIFNLPDPAGTTAGLTLDRISASGDTPAFRMPDLVAPFLTLAAGGSQTFLASLDTTQLGSYSATYVLSLADEDFGVGGTTATLQLTLMGQVLAVPPVPAVSTPEPATWLLLVTGLTGLCGYGWHRRQDTA